MPLDGSSYETTASDENHSSGRLLGSLLLSATERASRTLESLS